MCIHLSYISPLSSFLSQLTRTLHNPSARYVPLRALNPLSLYLRISQFSPQDQVSGADILPLMSVRIYVFSN